jgi:hypothetical protein
MKLLAAFLFASFLAFSQDTQFAAAGISGQPGSIAGTALYARALGASSGTFAFTVIDAVPASLKPFVVNTNTAVGISQKVFTLSIGGLSVPVFVPTAAGIAWSGSNSGWNWSIGGMAVIPIGRTNWRVAPTFRALKASVGGSGYQPIIGVLVGRSF